MPAWWLGPVYRRVCGQRSPVTTLQPGYGVTDNFSTALQPNGRNITVKIFLWWPQTVPDCAALHQHAGAGSAIAAFKC